MENEEKNDEILSQIEETLSRNETFEEKSNDYDLDSTIVEKEVSFDYNNIDFLDSVKKKEENEVKEKEKKQGRKVDLSKLSIIEKNELQKEQDIKKAIYGNKAAYQIIATQSGYSAKMLPLVNKDIINLIYSNLDSFHYKKMVYQIVWEKILDTSIGKLSFNDWLSMTSIEDLETFMYGIYCASFPDDTVFNFECDSCGETTEFSINKQNLFKSTNKESLKKRIDEISKFGDSIEKVSNFSLIGKTEGLELTDSKIIFEYGTPSLFDLLEILRIIPEKVIQRKKQLVTLVVYTKKVLIPSENNMYVEVFNKEEILKILENLSIDDSEEIENAISQHLEENHITYAIKNIECPHCHNKIEEHPISVEEILFSRIFERIQS